MKTNGRDDEQYKGGAKRQPPPRNVNKYNPPYFEHENENRILLFDLLV